MWAIVPLKSPEQAKSRLSGVLNSLARQDLFFAMARHVIATLLDTPGITRVAVVTASDVVDDFARTCEAHVIRQESDQGTAAAFKAAIDALLQQPLERVLMIAGDLPLLTPVAVQKMIHAAESGAKVVIAPDRKALGTNALLCTPPRAISPRFGTDSFRRHCDEAINAGLPPRVINTPVLSFDIDVVDDLDFLQTMPQASVLKLGAMADRRQAPEAPPRMRIAGAWS